MATFATSPAAYLGAGPAPHAKLACKLCSPVIQASPRRWPHLGREDTGVREYIRAALEWHEAVQEELRPAHEEMLSANQECQSTNEELETTKEEVQSTNEELTTTIEELRSKNEDLSRLNMHWTLRSGPRKARATLTASDIAVSRFHSRCTCALPSA